MSKLSEYMSLLPRGLKNPGKVIEGIANEIKLQHGKLSENEQNEILRRRAICEGCPFMSENAPTSEEYFKMTGTHYETKRTDKHCSSCGCPLQTKTASFSTDCGLTVLNEKFPNKAIPLKWFKYNT